MAKDQLPSDKKSKPYNTYLKYSGLGLQLLLLIAGAGWLGYRLDQYVGFRFPLFLLLFVLAAFAGAIYNLYRSINKP